MSRARARGTRACWCCCSFAVLLVGCQAPRESASAPPQSAQNPPRVSPRPPPSSLSNEQPAPPSPPVAPPSCQAGQVAWQPAHCGFDDCSDGKLVAQSRFPGDCLRPLAAHLTFDRNSKTLSVKQLGELENLAAQADAIGVKQLSVVGGQSWDETPDLHAKTPLSLARASLVREALAAATHIPVAASDGGTERRRYVKDESRARTVEVSMAPFDPSRIPAASAPFTLPWTICESEVTFRTLLTMTTHDGIVVAEICRNGKCSRAAMNSAYHAVWPGGMGSIMTGDFPAELVLEPTEEQLVRNGEFELGTGEGPASFNLRVAMQDPSIRETDTFRFRIFRRRTEVMLDWSGKLEFKRTRPHPTRDVPPCLSADWTPPPSGASAHSVSR